MRSSTSTPVRPTLTPTSSSPSPSTLGRRPVATSSSSPSHREGTPFSLPKTILRFPDTVTRSVSTLKCRSTPSDRSLVTRMSTRSGSSRGRMRGPFCSTVVPIPSRAKACDISVAMGPAPIMTMLSGARSRSQRFSLVRKPASWSPSIGGTTGRLPVQIRMNRVSIDRSSPFGPSPSTRTVLGPTIRAPPRMISTPSASKRSGLSSLDAISCWMARMRFHTSDVSISGATDGRP